MLTDDGLATLIEAACAQADMHPRRFWRLLTLEEIEAIRNNEIGMETLIAYSRILKKRFLSKFKGTGSKDLDARIYSYLLEEVTQHNLPFPEKKQPTPQKTVKAQPKRYSLIDKVAMLSPSKEDRSWATDRLMLVEERFSSAYADKVFDMYLVLLESEPLATANKFLFNISDCIPWTDPDTFRVSQEWKGKPKTDGFFLICLQDHPRDQRKDFAEKLIEHLAVFYAESSDVSVTINLDVSLRDEFNIRVRATDNKDRSNRHITEAALQEFIEVPAAKAMASDGFTWTWHLEQSKSSSSVNAGEVDEELDHSMAAA